jgi:N,N'-diacetyllegionaminate synthase
VHSSLARALDLATAENGRCLIIGEVAQSHDGSLGMAHAFIDLVAKAGGDAIKFQTHIAAAESTPGEPWRVKFSKQDATRYDYWKRMEFSEEQWRGLKTHADDLGLLFLSSPFSFEAIELLERIGIEAWKVASGEVSNSPALARMIQTGRPILLSSGMSSITELDHAVAQVREGGVPFALLQCTSSYPCGPESVGLNLIQDFRDRYRCPVGLSDHSGEIYPGLAAVTLGAQILEVHVTFSREMFGPDVPVSLTPDQLRDLVQGVRFIERMKSNPVVKDEMAEKLSPMRELFTKSVVARVDLKAGTILSEEHLTIKKPGKGIPAANLPQLFGRPLLRDLAADEMPARTDIG